MSAGFPDIMIFHRGRIIFIEMKRSRGGVVSPEQKDWHEFLRENGYTVIVGRGFVDAVNQFNSIKFDSV